MKPARKFAQVSRRFYRPEQFHVSRTQGFRYAREMLPVLHTRLSQLGNQKRAVRLLGVFVSNLRIARSARQIDSITALSLWDENNTSR